MEEFATIIYSLDRSDDGFIDSEEGFFRRTVSVIQFVYRNSFSNIDQSTG